MSESNICFVAMALGKADTDVLYEQMLVKTIRDCGFEPVRVDKLTHNERIDAKIRELIRDSVIVVADLTYSRPSTYWEAGYAERIVPVIYTCRSDHLSPRVDDPHGSLQIHFDVRNANLLTWDTPLDKAFRQRLKAVLLHEKRRSVQKRERQNELKQQRADFEARSSYERTGKIYRETLRHIRELGFVELEKPTRSRASSDGDQFLSAVNYIGGTDYLLLSRSIATFLILVPGQERFLKPALKTLFAKTFSIFTSPRYAVWETMPEVLLQKGRPSIQAIRNILLVRSIRKVQSTSVQDLLPGWRKGLDGHHYVAHHFYPEQPVPATPSRRAKTLMPTSKEVIVIDDIKSLSEGSSLLRATLDAVLSMSDTVHFPEVKR